MPAFLASQYQDVGIEPTTIQTSRRYVSHTTEHYITDLIAAAAILDAPEDDATFGGGRHHLVLVAVGTPQHLGVECDAFDARVEVG